MLNGINSVDAEMGTVCFTYSMKERGSKGENGCRKRLPCVRS